jgi:predicted O-methyltransferase YrrM
MFHDIPSAVRERMRALEETDARDRVDGTPKSKRLRQIPPETGKFLALLAASAPKGNVIEIGSSAGYSTLWLSLACRARGARVTTFVIQEEKAMIAAETFRLAGVEDEVQLVHGDALELLPEYGEIAFCFLDIEKDLYLACYELAIPRMVRGGLFAADNAINQAEELGAFLERARTDERVDSLVVPVGKGLLLCRKP